MFFLNKCSSVQPDCVAFAHIQQLWKFGTRFLLKKKKKKSNSFAMCQAQFTYKLIGNTVCNNFIIWPDNDNGSQLFIRNWICLSSLNLCVTVWFWNLAGSSKQPLGGKLWLEYSFWLKLYNETSTCATWNMGFYANPVLWNLYEAFLPSIPCTS